MLHVETLGCREIKPQDNVIPLWFPTKADICPKIGRYVEHVSVWHTVIANGGWGMKGATLLDIDSIRLV